MPHDPLPTFIRDWLASWTGNRPAQLLEFYAADAYYQDPARPQGLTGHAQLKPYFERLLAANPNWVWEAVEIFPTPRGCCLKWKATIPHAGDHCVLFGLDIVELDGQRITRNEVYFDPSALR
jgi:hypothetical protein